MTRSPHEARALAAAAVAAALSAGADEAEALVLSSEEALTRFAGNRIHQNVTAGDTAVSVRAVVDGRVGVASTNHTDDASLAACCDAATAAARIAPRDPAFPGLPRPRPAETPDRTEAATLAFDAGARARALGDIVDVARESGLTAAGAVAVSARTTAIANSRGVDVGMPLTVCRATVLAMDGGEGSGWASFLGRDAAALDARALGTEAADIALRSAAPASLDAGAYTVVLGPEAVADLVTFLGWYGASARQVEEGRSWMSGRLGERLMDARVSLVDDATAPHATGLTFDYEGMPKTRVAIVDGGVAASPVTDSYWAARTGRPDTGHALPAPDTFGPIPLDLQMAAGDASLDDLVGAVRSGVYVTRFHYVNIEDPTRATLTGMTRDGTFLIEGGHITSPVKNLRFTQSAVEALDSVLGIGSARRLVGEDAATLVPALLVEGFAFTGQTR